MRVKVRVTSHAPSPFKREGWGEGGKIVKFKFNLMSSGRGSFVYIFLKELNSFRIKSTNVTHTQARTIITLLNFLQAQSTSPVALRVAGFGFSLPGASPVRQLLL